MGIRVSGQSQRNRPQLAETNQQEVELGEVELDEPVGAGELAVADRTKRAMLQAPVQTEGPGQVTLSRPGTSELE